MDWLRQIDADKIVIFTLILTRVSGLFLAAPIFGTAEAPMTVRALLSFMLAALVMPTQWSVDLGFSGATLQYLVVVGSELVIGVCLGLGITVLLTGMQMAGELMSRIGGLTLSDIFDPTTNDNVPLFSRLLTLVSTAVFMAVGGHRVVLGGLLDTFQAIPLGGAPAMLLGTSSSTGGMTFTQSLLDMFLVLVTESFNLGIRASVPVVTAVLLATLVLGLIGRTLPQLNVLVLGFGLNAMLTFSIFSLSLGAMMLVFQERIEPTLQLLFEALRIPVHL